MSRLSSILNFLPLDPDLACAGQPGPRDFQALADGLGASQEQLCRLSLNAVEASWLSLADKVRLTRDIRLHAALHGVSLH